MSESQGNSSPGGGLTVPMASTPGRTSKALTWNVSLMFFAMLMIFLIKYAVVPPKLSAKENGIFSILWDTAFGVIIFCQSGLQAALLRFVPELEAGKGYRQISRLYHMILGSQLAVWIGCLVLIWFSRGIVGSKLGPSANLLLLGAMIFVFFRILTNSQLALLQAFRDVKWMAVVQMVTRGLMLVLMYIAVWGILTGSTRKIVGCFVVMAICDLLATLLAWPRTTSYFRRESDLALRVPLRRVLWYATPLVVKSIFVFIEQGQANTLLLGFFGQEELAGYYHLAYYLPQKVVEFVPIAIWPIILASFSEAYARDRRALAGGLRLYTKLIFALLLPLAVGGALFGDRLIYVLSGPGYAMAYLPCQVFFGLIALHILSAPLTVSLHVVEKTWLFVITAALGAVANLGLVVLLVPRCADPADKLLAAILAVGVDWAVVIVLQYWMVKRSVPGFSVPWASVGRTALACSFLGPVFFVRPYVHGYVTLLAAVVSCAGLVILGYRLLRVVDVGTLEVIAGSRLPLKDVLVAVFGSSAAKAQIEARRRARAQDTGPAPKA